MDEVQTSVKPEYTLPPAMYPPVSIALDQIDESGSNPRQRFDDLAELVASIQDHGVETPIKVRRKGERYELIGGARRVRASRQAGLAEIPALIEAVDDHEFLVRQLEDNKNRKDPHPLEEALAYRRALDDGWSVKALAARLGTPASTLYAALKMTELIPEWQERFFAGEVTAGHAVLLAKLPEARQREALDKRQGIYSGAWIRQTYVSRVMSVREVAEWIRRTTGQSLAGKKSPARKWPQANEHGVFEESQCIEVQADAKGLKAQVLLIECEDGWRYAWGATLPETSVGGLPPVTQKPYPSEREAFLSAVKGLLKWATAQLEKGGSKKQEAESKKLKGWAEGKIVSVEQEEVA